MFHPGDVVASGASGGKDSTVLMHVLRLLNERHNYGITLKLVSVDEGIVGYRDDSLRTVHRNAAFYGLPLTVVSYSELYGWTMDEIVNQIGTRANCTYCGVLRRHALERAAELAGANCIATGHNADDGAETLLMNFLRADVTRLVTPTGVTAERTKGCEGEGGALSRLKPLCEMYQKEVVLYAHFNRLDYFSTECTYATEAFRGHARGLLKELEAIQSFCVADMLQSGDQLIALARSHETSPGRVHPMERDSAPSASLQRRQRAKCVKCGYLTNHELCRACTLIQTLNKGRVSRALHSA